ncbi:MAG: translation initiation factor IF-3 [Phycisphaerales bacterium]|nr:translation initiation factor IF-3 [Phycisphaerales bacterium]
MNEHIRVPRVYLIDEHNVNVGEVDTDEAKRRAQESGLDLVEVSPDARPPVCRILDYGKFRYEQSKKEKANKAKSKAVEMKEVRLGRSMKIDPHDIEIRLNQARRFLMAGHKVQIVQNFRGREMMHRDRGNDRMADIIETLSDIAKVETNPRMMGKRMSVIFAPDKPKIEAIKRKLARERELAGLPPVEEEPIEEILDDIEDDDMDDVNDASDVHDAIDDGQSSDAVEERQRS